MSTGRLMNMFKSVSAALSRLGSRLTGSGDFGQLRSDTAEAEVERINSMEAVAGMQRQLQMAFYEAERLNDELSTREVTLTQNLNYLTELSARLEESETRFRLAGDGSTDGIWDWNIETSRFYCAPSWFRILGMPDESTITSDEWQRLVHPDDFPAFSETLRQALAGNEKYFRHEHRIRHVDGHFVWVALRARCANDAYGKVIRMAGTMTDTTRRKDYELRLQTSEAGLLEAQRLAKIGSYSVELATGKLAFTVTFPLVFGWEDENYFPTDATITNLVIEEDRVRLLATFKEAVAVKGLFHCEYRIRKPSGEIAYLRGSGRPAFNEKHQMDRYVGTVQDITRERLMLEEALEARRAAEEATRAKTQFLSTMSHEIRTPMNAVIGFTQLLLLENPRPDQTEHLSTLEHSASHLLSLINDILDFSKIDAGKVEFEQTAFDVNELLNNTIRMFRLKAEEKRLSLTLDNRANIKNYLIGDSVRINQIVNNLAGNAIKFTFTGGLSLGCRVLSDDEEGVNLEFSVRDTGIGIPADRQELVFDSFTQASSSTTRQFGGTGLGLAISRRLVELMGGQIWLESTLGKGSVFFFTLRFKKGELLPGAGHAANLPVPEKEPLTLAGVRVLVVEDNSVNVLVAKRFLQRWKAEIDFAENGAIAVDKVQQSDFDVVLMDLQMPVMDGYEATRRIRELPGEKYLRLPILALTASASIDVKTEVLNMGMDDYITKPFNPSELFSAICRQVSKSVPAE
ncbi:MAG: PAS domain-containing protein [Bacteroidota bacterium]